jgi:hypothetical protein
MAHEATFWNSDDPGRTQISAGAAPLQDGVVLGVFADGARVCLRRFNARVSGDDENKHLDLVERFLLTRIKHGTIPKPTKTKPDGARCCIKDSSLDTAFTTRTRRRGARWDMRLPTTEAELKSQMGMPGRYCEIVLDFAQLAAPLEAIMQEGWKSDTV